MAKVVTYFPKVFFEKRQVEIPPDWDVNFATGNGEEDIIEACRGADLMLVPAANPPITAKVIQNIDSVSFLQVFGAGYDKVDIKAAQEAKLPVANTPGQNATTVAEYTIGMIIALQRKVLIGKWEVEAGNHEIVHHQFVQSGLREVRGARIGLLGVGAIGRNVARFANIMGAKVNYYDIFRPDKKTEEELNLTFCSFEELLESSEILSLHLPLNDDTRWMISKDEFALMKPGTLLVNSARGEIVDQQALADALEGGHLGGAAIDHFSPDPPPSDHPLLHLPQEAKNRLIVTPHIAGVTEGSFTRMLQEAVANMQRVLAGETPKYIVNGINNPRSRS